jgi:hypothetical protein
MKSSMRPLSHDKIGKATFLDQQFWQFHRGDRLQIGSGAKRPIARPDQYGHTQRWVLLDLSDDLS